MIARAASLLLALSLGVLSAPEPAVSEKYCDKHLSVKNPPGRLEAGFPRLGIRSQRSWDAKTLKLKLPAVLGGRRCTEKDSATAAVGALTYRGGPHCTGTLVSPWVVVTAAHCVKQFDYTQMDFRLGVDADDAKPIKAVHGEAHPDYDPTRTGVNDIAVVYLSDAVRAPAPMPYRRQRLREGIDKQLLFVGYGVGGVGQPGTKRCLTMPVHEVCDDSFSYSAGDRNTCGGDSGGPALFYDGNGYRLAGITGWGDEECAEYGVSMDVGSQKFTDWITARIAERRREMEPKPPETLWPRELLVMEIWQGIKDSSGDYERRDDFGREMCEKVRADAPVLVEKMRVIEDTGLRPAYRIMKYEYLGYMLVLAAAVEPNPAEQQRLSAEAIEAAQVALREAASARDRADADPNAKHGHDYVVTDQVRGRVRYVLAKAQAIHRFRTGSPNREEIQQTLGAIPSPYLEKFPPERDVHIKWALDGGADPDEGCGWNRGAG